MDPFATAEHVAGLWRALTDDEATLADNYLAAASRIIRAEVSDIDDRIDAGTLDAELAGDVAVAMVLRVMKNPNGVRQRSETYADFSFSETVDQAISSGLLYLDDRERATLAKRGSGAFSIAPTQPTSTAAHLQRVAEHRASWDRP